MNVIDRLRSDQSGITLGEMLMGIATFLIVFGAIITMVRAAVGNQDRVAERVSANQRARPVLTRMIDTLHSSCVAPGIAPVQAGSTGTSLAFLSKFGNAVSPTPDKRVVSLSGTNLVEQVFPAVSGQPPSWTFSGTASSTHILLEGVGQGWAGTPSVQVPIFRYYAYIGGQVSTTPLPVPLSAANAAKVVQVDVAFAVSGGKNLAVTQDDSVTLTDSTTLRLEPASEDSAEVNLPCV